MNTNIMGENGYYATVIKKDGSAWGFNVKESHGNIFTAQVAMEILSWANKEYKKGCPKKYRETAYNTDEPFIKIRYDMTDYRESVSWDGDHIMLPVNKNKIGTYDAERNILRILEDGVPVYENNNGVVCRDKEALIDD